MKEEKTTPLRQRMIEDMDISTNPRARSKGNPRRPADKLDGPSMLLVRALRMPFVDKLHTKIESTIDEMSHTCRDKPNVKACFRPVTT
jgi:hypothetical protein